MNRKRIHRMTLRTSATRLGFQLQMAIYRQGVLWPLASLLLLLAAAVSMGITEPARMRAAVIRAEIAAPVTSEPVVVPSVNSVTEEVARLEHLDGVLRSEGELDREVRELYGIAQGTRLPIGEAQFSASTDGDTGLRRLVVTLPVIGRYVDVREFIDLGLYQLPNLSIDEIALSGSKGPGAMLDVRLRLSLWGRPADGLRRGPKPLFRNAGGAGA